MKSHFFNSLLAGALVLAAQSSLIASRPPLDLSGGPATIVWKLVDLGALRDPRVRLAGAWRLESSDPRIGGLSGLTVDEGRLLALTDGGMLAWLPPPPVPGQAMLRPLPDVAGNPRTKLGRDSEAILRDPAGRGWCVAFEQHHQIILYDAHFKRTLERVAIDGTELGENFGIEALAGGDRIRWIAESSGVSDAFTLPDGRVLLLKRGIGLSGFSAAVGGLGGTDIPIPVGPLDNAEGLAAEVRPDGGLRLWIVTDNDFRRWRRTLLIAIDLPAAAGEG